MENKRTPSGSAVRPTDRLLDLSALTEINKEPADFPCEQSGLAPHNSCKHTKEQTTQEAAVWTPVSVARRLVRVAAASMRAAQFGWRFTAALWMTAEQANRLA